MTKKINFKYEKLVAKHLEGLQEEYLESEKELTKQLIVICGASFTLINFPFFFLPSLISTFVSILFIESIIFGLLYLIARIVETTESHEEIAKFSHLIEVLNLLDDEEKIPLIFKRIERFGNIFGGRKSFLVLQSTTLICGLVLIAISLFFNSKI